jgi:hypothetical protein
MYWHPGTGEGKGGRMKAERAYVLAPMGRVGVGGGEGKEDVRASGALMIRPPLV